MTRPITRDPVAMRAYLADELVGACAPRFTPLTAEELRQLREQDFAPLAARVGEYLAYHRWLLDHAPAQHLAKHWPGYQIKQKELERMWKLLFPQTVQIQVAGEIRALPDAALLRLFGELGVSETKALAPGGTE